jgi:16S rRNA (adenine1518-N6/adenine1519-N6)-dimethyltransferase
VTAPKKSLGQHFLHDEHIAQRIVQSFCDELGVNKNVLEIGPGKGALTKYLLTKNEINFQLVEVDEQMIDFLLGQFPSLKNKIIAHDFLTMDFKKLNLPVSIIGNFPYNISTQIVFKILENKNDVPLMTGMFQKEVAKRICSMHGNKEYGITSVLAQAFYDCTYLFSVSNGCFSPPPKVESGVIKLKRKEKMVAEINDEKIFFLVVKTAFNQRRKMLRNALRGLEWKEGFLQNKIFDLRAEQLSVTDFIHLSNELKS